MIGIIGWAVVFAAMLIWEGLSLSLRGSQWPSISDMARSLTRPLAGRWLFFALWLWFGWHYFIRGWTFLLRGPAPGGGKGGGGSKSATELIGQVVFPLAIVYSFILATLVLSARRADRPASTPALGWRTVVRNAAITVGGGYAVFVLAIGVYRLAAGHAGAGLVGAALRDGAVLAFGIAVPVFAVLSLAEHTLRRRRAPS